MLARVRGVLVAVAEVAFAVPEAVLLVARGVRFDVFDTVSEAVLVGAVCSCGLS